MLNRCFLHAGAPHVGGLQGSHLAEDVSFSWLDQRDVYSKLISLFKCELSEIDSCDMKFQYAIQGYKAAGTCVTWLHAIANQMSHGMSTATRMQDARSWQASYEPAN